MAAHNGHGRLTFIEKEFLNLVRSKDSAQVINVKLKALVALAFLRKQMTPEFVRYFLDTDIEAAKPESSKEKDYLKALLGGENADSKGTGN